MFHLFGRALRFYIRIVGFDKRELWKFQVIDVDPPAFSERRRHLAAPSVVSSKSSLTDSFYTYTYTISIQTLKMFGAFKKLFKEVG